MTAVLPQCVACRRLFPDDPDRPGLYYCEAFPAGDGIPEEILTNEFSHVLPYPGDGGLTFEPKDGRDE